DEDGALAALNAALNDPLLLNLNNRRHFELRLLEGLGERDPLPWATAKAATAAFRWDEQWTNLPGDYQYLVDRLMAVPLTEERLAELRRDASKIIAVIDDDCKAAKLLLGKYHPILFSLSLAPDLLDAMTRLLRELRQHYPSILKNEVDPKVLAWWTKATHDSLSSAKKRTNKIKWIVFGVAFMLAIAQSLGRNF
ncbi:MAG: hypothetical protein IMF08_00570, partial [Proteobacteria bacterium]|nr:hypothetical protein [Pseudomonadota bacterium]